jgi:hypothetical protein
VAAVRIVGEPALARGVGEGHFDGAAVEVPTPHELAKVIGGFVEAVISPPLATVGDGVALQL